MTGWEVMACARAKNDSWCGSHSAGIIDDNLGDRVLRFSGRSPETQGNRFDRVHMDRAYSCVPGSPKAPQERWRGEK